MRPPPVRPPVRRSWRVPCTVSSVRDGEPEIRFYGLENLTHKVNGARVTYDVVSDAGILWHGVGNNRTGKFATRSVKVEVFRAMCAMRMEQAAKAEKAGQPSALSAAPVEDQVAAIARIAGL